MRHWQALCSFAALLAAACERGGGEAPAPATAPQAAALSRAETPSLAGAPTTTTGAPIERATLVAFVHRWAALQQAGDLLGHAELYAPGFVASERVDELSTPFDLTGWLEHRRPAPGTRVLVPALEILRGEGVAAVVIEPRSLASALSDAPKTTLLLERAGERWRILREDVVEDAVDRRGPCAALLEQLARAGASLQYFANLAGARATSPRWATVSSRDDADERSDDGYAWELWAMLRSSAGEVASVSRASPSGDWAREASFCFRSDGSPLEVIDRYRTLSPDGQLVDDVVTTRYSREGEERSSKTVARYLVSGQPAPADAYLRPPPLLVPRAPELPFAALLSP